MIFIHGVWVLLITRFYTPLNEESIFTKEEKMDKAKTVLMVSGVVLIWGAGLYIAWKGGELLGKQVGKVCLAGTEKLVSVLS